MTSLSCHRLPWPEVVTLVRRQMRSLAGASSELDDLTQLALERLVRCESRFEGRSEFSTFSYRVCTRVAINHWRSWRRWLRRFELGSDTAPEPSAPGADVLSARHERERALRLHRLLDQLDPMKRIVLTLADLEELPASRIAEILECPEATVRSRLRLARAALARLLARESFFRDDRDDQGGAT